MTTNVFKQLEQWKDESPYKQLRKDLGHPVGKISISKMAAIVGVSTSAWLKWEGGHCNPSPERSKMLDNMAAGRANPKAEKYRRKSLSERAEEWREKSLRAKRERDEYERLKAKFEGDDEME